MAPNNCHVDDTNFLHTTDWLREGKVNIISSTELWSREKISLFFKQQTKTGSWTLKWGEQQEVVKKKRKKLSLVPCSIYSISLWTLTSPQQVDFIVVDLDPVVAEPPGAVLPRDLPRLPHTSGIHPWREEKRREEETTVDELQWGGGRSSRFFEG